MTTNPYSANTSLPPLPSNTNPSHRRPSYANVAAGAAANLNPARFNTLAAAISPAASAMSVSQRPQPQPTRQRSRSSLRSMEIDVPSGSTAWKRPASSWSNDLGRPDGRMGCLQHDEHPPFFTPSYLRRSRHVQKLKKAWDEHVAELQENMQLNPPPAPPPRRSSLSSNSSNVNLSKLGSSHIHRGVVQDVIERIPPPAEEDNSRALPSRLNEDDRWTGLEIMAEGSEVKFTGVTKTHEEAASVRADHVIPKECGLYYYEVTVLSRQKDAYIGIGFSGRKVSLNRLPGWEADSWAYHGDDGFSFAGTPNGKAYGPKFAMQDVVGCGVNFRTGKAFFTKNGVYLGVAFSGIKGDRLYPSVGMRRPGDHVRINFGRYPFVFDIERMMEQERQTVMSEITLADLASLHPPDGEHVLIHSLIGQYLAHEGYIETAKAFAQDVNEQQKTLSPGDAKFLHLPNAEDDVHAANRQKIRKSILDGDIDKALKFTNCFYPHVLEEERNRDVHFRLRCRKFIEMMRRYTELSAAVPTVTSPSAVNKSVESLNSNGHVDGGIDIEEDEDDDDIEDEDEEDDTTAQDLPDTQMELDDQLHREATRTLHPLPPTDDVDMDASEESLSSNKASFMKQNELLAQALAYGQELQAAFGADPRPQTKKQLSDIFAIMAYTNPSESVVGQLLDPRGRVQIAEDLNGAILVSLGKPPSAALEKISAQTEALMDEAAARTGGPSAFINVRKDFLQA